MTVRKQITTSDLQPGVEWTFVHSSGKRTLYIYDRQMAAAFSDPAGKLPGHDAMHALRNPETDKCAQISEAWLCDKRRNGGSHWLLGDHVEQALAA